MYDKDDDESLDNLAEYFDLLSEDKEVRPICAWYLVMLFYTSDGM